jgi:hypothetical protein
VTNSGPSAALGVTVQEDLPVGGAVTDATATQGGYDAATGIWTVGAGAPAVLTLTVAYDRPGATVSTVTVAAGLAAPCRTPDSRRITSPWPG